jgi:hypothetical protein
MQYGDTQSGSFILTDAAWYALTVTVYTSGVSVWEAPAPTVPLSPTSAYYVARPTSADAAETIALGQSFLFKPGALPGQQFVTVYKPGDIAGYLRLVPGGGSTTFCFDMSGSN